MSTTRTSDMWWKNAVIYCLDVETFLDWNDDGVGDLAGLSERIDYLAGMGVSCLWLMPFYPSPNRDDGYDIADYYGVDERLRRAWRNHGWRSEVWFTTRSMITRRPRSLAVRRNATRSPSEPSRSSTP